MAGGEVRTLKVGLVGCASQKLKRPAPARDLYVSQLFKKASVKYRVEFHLEPVTAS